MGIAEQFAQALQQTVGQFFFTPPTFTASGSNMFGCATTNDDIDLFTQAQVFEDPHVVLYLSAILYSKGVGGAVIGQQLTWTAQGQHMCSVDIAITRSIEHF